MKQDINKPLTGLEQMLELFQKQTPVPMRSVRTDQYFNNGLLSSPPINVWEVCPLCKGIGSRIPHFKGSTALDNCTVCNGKKIISSLTGLPPQEPSNTTITNDSDNTSQAV